MENALAIALGLGGVVTGAGHVERQALAGRVTADLPTRRRVVAGSAYPCNQDSDTTWIDQSLQHANTDVFRLFKCMIAFRKVHPSLCRSRFWRENVRWYGVGPGLDFSPDSRCLAFCLDGQSQQDDNLYVPINGSWSGQRFEIQTGSTEEWSSVTDATLPSPNGFRDPGKQRRLSTPRYTARGRSVVVLSRRAGLRGA